VSVARCLDRLRFGLRVGVVILLPKLEESRTLYLLHVCKSNKLIITIVHSKWLFPSPWSSPGSLCSPTSNASTISTMSTSPTPNPYPMSPFSSLSPSPRTMLSLYTSPSRLTTKCSIWEQSPTRGRRISSQRGSHSSHSLRAATPSNSACRRKPSSRWPTWCDVRTGKKSTLSWWPTICTIS